MMLVLSLQYPFHYFIERLDSVIGDQAECTGPYDFIEGITEDPLCPFVPCRDVVVLVFAEYRIVG